MRCEPVDPCAQLREGEQLGVFVVHLPVARLLVGPEVDGAVDDLGDVSEVHGGPQKAECARQHVHVRDAAGHREDQGHQAGGEAVFDPSQDIPTLVDAHKVPTTPPRDPAHLLVEAKEALPVVERGDGAVRECTEQEEPEDLRG